MLHALLLAGAVTLAAASPRHRLDGPDLPCFERASEIAFTPVKCPLPTQWSSSVPTKAPKPEYPRPQLVRDDTAQALSLNGVWEWQPASGELPGPVPSGPLNSSVLVPFPVESCLSGVNATYMSMWYKLSNVTAPSAFAAEDRLLLHVEASDWRTTVFVNGVQAGDVHEGGYSRFTRDITALVPSPSAPFSIAVHVYDPSDTGSQPMGKQRISSITRPGGDHYTPSSGIWESVWLEAVPSTFVERLTVLPSLTSFRVNVSASSAGAPVAIGTGPPVSFTLLDPSGKAVANGSGLVGVPADLVVPPPRALWTAASPSLYSIVVSLGGSSAGDSVRTYAGLRTVGMGKDQNGTTRPLLNGEPVFFNGWLDQGWWPDGQYAAPSDAALVFDLTSVKSYGLNVLRKHQKVESSRYYFHASTMGIMIWQDAPQHFGGGFSWPQFMDGVLQMVHDLYSVPAVVQWVVFNEGDCVTQPGSNPPLAISLVRAADDSRIIDTNSGGPANNLHIADVNDLHHYSPPAFLPPSDTQYASLGEFGGIGLFIPGHVWPAGKCYGYDVVSSPADLTSKVIGYLQTVGANQDTNSAAIYTQTTDIENECDGPLLNYDRTAKLTSAQVQQIAAENQKLINGFSSKYRAVP